MMENLDSLVAVLFNNAEMTLDMTPCGSQPTPIFLGRDSMSCVDGTKITVSLVLDEEYLHKENMLFYRFEYNGSFLLEPIPICRRHSWYDEVQSEETRAKAKAVLLEFQELKAEDWEKLIEKDGMSAIERLILYSTGPEKPYRVPASCFVTSFGEVFQGVDGLNEYCKCQYKDTTPYVLKRTTLVEDEYILNCRQYDYMICGSAADAERWMTSLFYPDFDLDRDPEEPPHITYIEGMLYMTIH